MRLISLVPILAFASLSAAEFDPGVTTTLGLGPKYQELISGGCDGFMGGFTSRANTEQVRVIQTSCSAIANILWPGEAAKLGFQVQNKQGTPITGKGTVSIIRIGLWTSPKEGDFFKVGMRKLEELPSIPVDVSIPAKGFQDFSVDLNLPETFGGYVVMIDVPGLERHYVASIARSLKNPKPNPFNRLAMDIPFIPALLRMGAQPNRTGFTFRATKDADYEEYYQRWAKYLRELHAAGLTTTIEWGHDAEVNGPKVPLGVRRQHLEMIDGKLVNKTEHGDIVWMPQFDPDFKAYAKRVALEFGAPKGPVIAMRLWNEPWEGASIAGWGADMIRFREIFTVMAEAVEEARAEGGVKILLSGCDSSSNTFDKLFCDGKDTFVNRLDAMSVHYQSNSPASTVRAFLDRKGERGPVQTWDTESWIANSDDRVPACLATMYALGQQRAVGIHSGRTVSTEDFVQKQTAAGMEQAVNLQAWPVAAAVGALIHFVGDRPFEKIERHGLPWTYVFNGEATAPDDGCIVVVGDLAPVFGAGRVIMRDVRPLKEVEAKRALHARLATLTPGSDEHAKALAEFSARQPFAGAGANLTLPADARWGVYDSVGNALKPINNAYVVPIDDSGWYLRGDGKPGSFAALRAALATAPITGLAPLSLVIIDPREDLAAGATVTVNVTNVLNRAINATIGGTMGAIALAAQPVSLAPGETKVLNFAVKGAPAQANLYSLSLVADAGKDGATLVHEVVRVNVVAKRSIKVDAQLDDWQGVLPLTIASDGTASPTDAEAAWWPDRPFASATAKGLATGYIAYDDQGIAFAAKIADQTVEEGVFNFQTLDEDQFFYPEKVMIPDGKKGFKEATWPAGVRRFSYAKFPWLPSGGAPDFDNVQIGFNAVDDDHKPWYPATAGTMKGFADYWSTDYEYALNRVAPQYGGGNEVVRLRHPEQPNKHHYPRQPRTAMDGPVQGAELAIRHENGLRVVEARIPWSEIPAVKARLDAGKPLKFSFRVNDGAGVGCLELAKDRSVSRVSSYSFKVDWNTHWANEVAFGWEK